MGSGGWLVVLVVILLAAVAIFGATSDAPEVASNNHTELEMYRIDMEATIAAATPSTGEVLNANRQSLYETNGKASDSALMGWVTLFSVVIIGALLFVMFLQNSADPMKQLRLMYKELRGGGRGRRSLPAGRTRTIPTLPSMDGQGYRQLTAPTEQWSQETDGYEF